MRSEQSDAATPSPTRVIPLRVANKTAYVWDVDDIAAIRAQHRICGVLTGTLPHLSQQNVFLGVPLVLMPEEAALLVDIGAAALIDDPHAHHQPTPDALRKWSLAHEEAARAQIAALESKAALAAANALAGRQEGDADGNGAGVGDGDEAGAGGKKGKGRGRVAVNSEEAQRKRKEREEKKRRKAAEEAERLEKARLEAGEGAEDAQNAVPGEGKEEAQLQQLPAPTTAPASAPLDLFAPAPSVSASTAEPASKPSNPNASTHPYTITIPAPSSSLPWYDPSEYSSTFPSSSSSTPSKSSSSPPTPPPTTTCTYTTIAAAREAGVWDYPATLAERARCGVFKDLWRQGYFMGGGIKFGGEYLVYPGDPLRYHSHFAASVVESPVAKLRPMEIVAHGRLGTATKKAHLLCGWDDEKQEVSYLSIEWAGFG